MIRVNEVKPGIVIRSSDIYLKGEGKPQLGDRMMKVVRSVIASNEVLYIFK